MRRANPGEPGLKFRRSLALGPAMTREVKPFLRDLTGQWKEQVPGALKFAWVAPNAFPGDEGIPLGFPDGGFVFSGLDPEDTSYKLVIKDTTGNDEELKARWWKMHVKDLQIAMESERDGIKLAHSGVIEKLEKAKDDKGRQAMYMSYSLNQVDQGSLVANLYFKVLWWRFPYAFLIFTLLVLAAFIGMQMQLFYSLFEVLNDPQDMVLGKQVRIVALFFALPFAMTVCAILVDQLCDLVLDAVEAPYFTKFRATLVVAMQDMTEGKRAKMWCFTLVDWIGLVVLEGFPLLTLCCELWTISFGTTPVVSSLTFVGHGGKLSNLACAYFSGLTVAAFFFALALTVADLVVGIKVTKAEGANRGPAWHLERLQRLLDRRSIYPGPFKETAIVDQLLAESFNRQHDKTADDEPESVDCEHFMLYRQSPPGSNALLVFCICALPWVVAVPLTFQVSQRGPALLVAAVSLASAAYGTSRVWSNFFPGLIGGTYWAVLAFFIVCAFSSFAGGTQFLGNGESLSTGQQNIAVPVAANATTELPHHWDAANPYAVCRQPWGTEGAPVTALDLASLAWISYEPSCDHVADMVKTSFVGETDLIECTEYAVSPNPPRLVTVRFPAKDGGQDTVVVAVKGTSTIADVYYDTDLYATIKVLQAFNFLAPVLAVVPREMVQWVIYHVRRIGPRGGYETSWDSVIESINRYKSKYPDAHFVITGHSLGGGIGEVVSARMGIPGLLFSAPGSRYSSRVFGVSEEQMQRNAVVVIPDNDVVPRVDMHDGTVQNIQCKKKDGSAELSLLCHSLAKTSCEMWRSCGDAPWYRDYSATCSKLVGKEELNGYYQP